MIPRRLILLLVLGLLPMAVAQGVAAETKPAPHSVWAVDAARISALTDTLMMGQVMAVMRDEGIAYGQTLEDEMFAGRGGERWRNVVAEIYAPDRMRQRFDAALVKELAGSADDLAQIEAFFGSEQGQRVLQLEVDARRALLDTAVEDAAKVAWADMAADKTARADLILRFTLTNDLIESNVMGSLNANLAFYRGMAASGSFPEEMTEEQMLQDVWGQESSVRDETESWLYPFLALAYQPLSDGELAAYTAFSETAPGRRLNAALFAAYDVVFSQISEDLGRAAALQMLGEDI
jgi:hypothetical protein